MKSLFVFVLVSSLMGWYIYNKNLDNEMADFYTHCQGKNRKLTGETRFDDSGNCDCMVQSMRKERSILNDYVFNKPRKKEKHHYLVCSKEIVVYSVVKELTEDTDVSDEEMKKITCVANKFYERELQGKAVDDMATLKACNYLAD